MAQVSAFRTLRWRGGVSWFEPIVSGHIVERSVRDALQQWFPTYLQELEIQSGRQRGQLPVPQSWVTGSELEHWAEQQMPAVMILSPGLSDAPRMDGDGRYTAPFSISVTIIVSARTRAATHDLARIYAATARAIMLQKRGLHSLSVLGVDWDDESYDDIDSEDQRTLAAGTVQCTYWVDGVVNRYGGPDSPANPTTQPGDNWPVIETVVVDVRKEDL